MDSDKELHHFKTALNLVEVAAAQGYEIDARESSRNSIVMRGPGDDKIIVANHQGVYVYFSVRDVADNGSVIDFVQKRTGKSLGQVRQFLRGFTGGKTVSRRTLPRPATTKTDIPGVRTQYAAMQPALHNRFLQERGLFPATLADPRFASTMRQDARGNIAFAHTDENGLCGYELRNHGFYGFAPGGIKRCWTSTNIREADTAFIAESAIDALSHAQLFPNALAYVSLGGGMSPEQGAFLGSLLQGKHIIVGTDNDEAGERCASLLLALSGYLTCRRAAPPAHAKDWNALLSSGTRQ